MKKLASSIFLLCAIVPGVMAGTPFPQFPAFDPFVKATGTNGGSAYAAGSNLAEQTNAMGQNWYGIDTSGTAANSITNTGYSLSYLGLPGFSGNEILLRNVAGPGARMFIATNASGFIVLGPVSLFYSMVINVSNINSLSTAGDYVAGISDQGTIADQTSQPGTVAARLYFRASGGGYQIGISKQSAVTNWASTVYSTGTPHLVVIDYEDITTDATSGSRDNVRLWIDPATNTFGALVQPAENANVLATDSDLTPYLSAVNLYNHATDTPNALYITDYRAGTNWDWVTGGPGIGYGPIASTNCPTGVLNLNVIAMNNGTPNTYNWQFNGTNLANGPSISGSGATVSGATNAALTISGMDTGVTQADSGAYTVVVSNAYGAVTSAVSSVTAYSTPVITVEPTPASLMLYPGETVAISLTAVGYNPSYYWYSNNTLIPTATAATLAISSAADASIYCVVSNSIGMATSAVVSLAVAPLPTAPYPLTVINDHPIGFWPLNEGPDNNNGDDGVPAFDYAGGNNGYYTNVVLGVSGYAAGLAGEYGYPSATDTNTAAQFGTFSFPNSYVAQIPNISFAATQAAPSFSVEAWASADGLSSGAAVVNKGWGGGGEQFNLDYTTGWRFFVRNAAGTAISALSTNVTDGYWHHLAGVVDSVHSNVTLYVDGVARASASFSPGGGLLASTNEMVIGSRMSAETGQFNDNFQGSIQDVAVYNYALTAAQVANHYYAAGIAPSVLVPNSVTVNEGTTLSVTAAVTGSPPLGYQWSDTTAGAALAGQTNATLTINNISSAAYNQHFVVLSASNSFGQVTSSPMIISVQSGAPGSIAVAPADIAVYAGLPLPLPFVVTEQGSAPFTYQWSTNGANIPGATSSTYASAGSLAGTYNLVCTVGNRYGTNPSSPVTLTIVPVPADAYGAAVLNSGPIAFWRLDEPPNSTTAYDYVGGHNAAYQNTINGEPSFEASETATVFGSNGILNSVAEEINNTAAGIPLLDFSTQGGNAEFTIETWIQAPAGGGSGILEKGYVNNTQFAFDTGGTGGSFRFVIHNSAANGTAIYTANSGTVLPDGNWHHLAGVCDEASGQIHMYADGVLKNSSSVPPGTGVLSLSSSYPVVIGGQQAQTGSSFSGLTNTTLSQVALYAYAMTSNQVAAHYSASLPPLAPFNITSWSNTAGTNFTINWLSVPQYTYQVQVAVALSTATNTWSNIGSPIVATGTNTSYTHAGTNVPAAYFRVVGY